MKKTIGNLIDELTITNMKIWACEDIKHDSDDDAKIAEATRKTNKLNPYRNKLIQAIDEGLNDIANGIAQDLYGQGDTKSYGKKV